MMPASPRSGNFYCHGHTLIQRNRPEESDRLQQRAVQGVVFARLPHAAAKAGQPDQAPAPRIWQSD